MKLLSPFSLLVSIATVLLVGEVTMPSHLPNLGREVDHINKDGRSASDQSAESNRLHPIPDAESSPKELAAVGAIDSAPAASQQTNVTIEHEEDIPAYELHPVEIKLDGRRLVHETTEDDTGEESSRVPNTEHNHKATHTFGSTIASSPIIELVSPESPGSMLNVEGTVAIVESYAGVAEAASPALTVALTREPEVKVLGSSPYKTQGFTHEQELFRMKWGWTAYEAVQRAATEESNSAY